MDNGLYNIDKPDDYFNTVLYAGNSSTQSITGVGFAPDWVWFKARNNTDTHAVFDIVRGVQQRLIPQSNDSAEGTQSNGLTAFDSDGFTIGDAGIVNQGYNYVAWNWKANGAGVSNTDGSITSTVSANTTSGFSIVSYTGTGSNATVGHGLGVAPDMIITKVRANSGNNWAVFHKSLGAGNIIWLNLTNAVSADTSFWNNTTPTSSVFSIGTQGDTNRSANTIIAYCFAEKKDLASLVLTQVMVLLMVRLCTQDLNQLLLLQKELMQEMVGLCLIIKEVQLILWIKMFKQIHLMLKLLLVI
jgi:hypothetical protein